MRTWQNKYTQALDQVDELIANYVADGASHITSINGVSFQFASLDDLFKLRNHFKQLSDMTNVEAGLQKPIYKIRNKLYL